VSDSDKDVRGWPLKDNNGEYIGTVDNLLISKNDERVVYLDVEVDEEITKANDSPYSRSADEGANTFLNEEGENHIIVPVGMVNLDLDEEIANTPKISRRIFSETKRIEPGSMIDRHYETNVLESYNRDNQVDFTPEERKDNDTGLYKRKEYKKMHTGAY
jgi:sporulation protein YlmC with PRC-barrel domain